MNNNIKIYHQNILQTDYEPYDLLIVNDPLKKINRFYSSCFEIRKLKKNHLFLLISIQISRKF